MGIEKLSGGGFVATGSGVEYFRLAALKSMVRLESIGMRSSHGPVRPKIAAEFGLKARDQYAK